MAISFNDVFNQSISIPYDYDNQSEGIHTFGKVDWSERQIRLTYRFMIGNENVKKHRQRSTASEEERARAKN